jgi:hypothetical protein
MARLFGFLRGLYHPNEFCQCAFEASPWKKGQKSLKRIRGQVHRHCSSRETVFDAQAFAARTFDAAQVLQYYHYYLLKVTCSNEFLLEKLVDYTSIEASCRNSIQTDLTLLRLSSQDTQLKNTTIK